MSKQNVEKRCPRRQDSSLIKHITYSYISPLLQSGQSVLLQLNHYPLIEDVDEAESVAERLNNAWQTEKKRKNPKIWKAAVSSSLI
jgi:hypothetical protein